MNAAHVILEIANCHGGDFAYLRELLDELAEFHGERFGVKLQAFTADGLALRDYPHHGTYRRLQFSLAQWSELIDAAAKTKRVWLDLFDDLSLEVLRAKADAITGVKLQASSLENRALRRGLRALDLSQKIVIANVSGYAWPDVERVLGELRRELRPREIVPQVGIQSYPTDLADAGLAKIPELRRAFPGRIAFADHADCESADAIWLPTIARAYGAAILEKHVRHSTRPTEFDGQSALPVARVREMIATLDRFESAFEQPFITKREEEYLAKTVATPVLRRPLREGAPVGEEDLDFRRTAQVGLPTSQVLALGRDGHVLGRSKETGAALESSDFRRATVATIIACRLKSSRLPRKALADIGGRTSVERCIASCRAFRGVNHAVLATSDLAEDAPLAEKVPPGVLFHKGHPVDVIERYLGIIERLRVDVFIRVTADNVYPSAEITELLLRSHFERAADYTTTVDAALGTNVEIVNVSALHRLRESFPTTEQSEYMTYYFVNNPSVFRLNFVALPAELVRPYRLTLDYPEDLELLRAIEAHFAKSGREPDLRGIFAFLDANPDVARLNAHLDQRYRVDPELIAKLKKETTIAAGA